MKTKHKKMSRAGGITVPKEMRTQTGLFPGTAVDITVTDNGILIGRLPNSINYDKKSRAGLLFFHV